MRQAIPTRALPARGLLIGLALTTLVFAAAGAIFAASDDTGAPTQWTVGEDGGFPGDADNYGVALDLPNEPVAGADVFDAPPAS